MLDKVAQVVGAKDFDSKLWERTVSCFEEKSTDDLPLVDVSDNFWKGVVSYALGDADIADDTWGDGGDAWREDNPTPLAESMEIDNLTQIIIQEPCNTISNTAYLRSAYDICDANSRIFDDDTNTAFVQSFLMQSFGSFFFHASATDLSFRLDI